MHSHLRVRSSVNVRPFSLKCCGAWIACDWKCVYFAPCCTGRRRRWRIHQRDSAVYYRSAVESHKKRATFKSAYWKRHNSTGDRDQLNPAAALYDQDEKLILVTGNKKGALALSLTRSRASFKINSPASLRSAAQKARAAESNLTALLFQRCVTDWICPWNILWATDLHVEDAEDTYSHTYTRSP